MSEDHADVPPQQRGGLLAAFESIQQLMPAGQSALAAVPRALLLGELRRDLAGVDGGTELIRGWGRLHTRIVAATSRLSTNSGHFYPHSYGVCESAFITVISRFSDFWLYKQAKARFTGRRPFEVIWLWAWDRDGTFPIAPL